ncbi:retrovirus-related Pol polyprotein from transposon TNT 1-94, partial [Trifolium pratense]
TLTSKFEHIVVTIEEKKDLSEIKIEDLQSTLEAHEMKHGGKNHGKEYEQALFVKFKRYQDEKKKWQKKKESKKGKECDEDKPEFSKEERGEVKRFQDYEEANVAHDDSTSEEDVNFMVTITDEEETEVHMIENDSGSDQDPLVMMATTNDELVKSEGIGDMLIKGKNENQTLITGVMYVPNVHTNVLNIGQLVEKCFTMTLGNNQMNVYNEECKLVLCATLSQSRTFQVKFESSNSQCFASEAIHEAAWL